MPARCPANSRRGPLATLVALLLLLTPALGVLAAGDDTRDIQEERRRRIRHRIADINDEIADARDDVERLTVKAQELGDRLAGVQSAFDESRRVGQQAAKERDAAVKAFADAKAAKAAADIHYRVTRKRLLDAIERDPDLLAAMDELRDKRDAHRAARDAALAPLQSSGDYRAAVTASQQADRQLTALKDDPDTPRGLITLAARDLLEAQGKVTALEEDALVRDRHYTLAWIRWIGSGIDVVGTRAALAVAAYNDPRHLSALEETLATRDAIDKAEAARDTAVKRAAQTERAFRVIAGDYDEIKKDYDRALRSLESRREDIGDLQVRRDRLRAELDIWW